MIGTQVQQFKILEKLGQGGMGEVFVAEDTNLDRKVALKFLPPHYSANPDFKARFEHEAKAAASLNHPNIITIHHFGEHEGRLFIAMELIEGQTLAALIKSDALTIEKATDVALQISEALSAAHEKGIVHRDVKPANILIDSSGRVKILDFGLAKSARATLDTQSGTTLGTVQYESPEQSRGDKVDVRSDLFSLGVVLYEMISGQLPFKGEFEDAIRYAIAHEEPEPLARYKSGVPEDLQRIVSKLLEKDPTLRYQTAAGVAADLKRLQRGSDPQISTVEQPTYQPRPQKRRWLPIVIPASVAVVAVAILLVFKPWSIDVKSTHEAVAGEDRLAVMYFDNLIDREDPQRLGEIVTNLLITAMSTSEHVRVVSSQRLYDILKRLGREGERTVDRDVATQVAQEADAKWMLLGNIVQVEPEMVVTAQFVEVASGNVLASQRIIGEPDERVFSLVDRLADELWGGMDVPQQPGNATQRGTAELTTSSTEAYRLYLEGMDYLNKLMDIQARDCFRKAIELDSTFAMAYYQLSTSLGATAEAGVMAEKAYKYIDHASDLDRRYIRAWRMEMRGDRHQIEVLEDIVRDYPDEKGAYMALSTAYADRGELEKSIEASFKVLEIDPLYKLAYNGLAYTYDRLGEQEKSIWAINKYIELAPNEPNPYDSRGELYAKNGQLDKAITSYRKAAEVDPRFVVSIYKLGGLYVERGEYSRADSTFHQLRSHSSPDIQVRGWFGLALVPIHRGQFGEAIRILEDGLKEIHDKDGKGFPYARMLSNRSVLRFFAGQKEEAAEDMERSLRMQLAAGEEKWLLFKGRSALIMELSDLGRRDSALAILQYLRSTSTDQRLIGNWSFWVSLSLAEYALGNLDSATAHAQRAIDIERGFLGDLMLGRCYLETGRLGDAVRMLEGAENRYDESRMWALGWSVMVHYWLGQAYEQSGWNDKAADQYGIFLRIWKNADPGLPQVEDARKRLAALQS